METSMLVLVILFITTPILVIYIEGKYAILKKVGAVLICYGIGLVVGNIDILPEGADKYQDILTSITIPLALPLILFSMDVKKWLKNAGSAFSSLAIGLFTVLVMIFVGYWIFKDSINDIWKVSGMLVGVYTGGTPNMAAMKTALDVPQELYILTHTYEMMLGAIYLVFILSIGQRVFLWILPAYKSPNKGPKVQVGELHLEDDFESYDGIFTKKTFLPLLGAFGLSVAILGASYGLSRFFSPEFANAAIIIFITTFGVAFSFVPKIKAIKKTFQLGMYIILIFCLAVASMADVSKLADISFSLFYYVGIAMFGSHILHVLIARIFKIDADTVIISGSALICSPPFVPVVAAALKNKEIILTGMIVGVAGYAIGNYLGIFIAYLLK
ncbi:MAG: DUF819 family protein [Prolixibacteraceae bacterium]|jgi:uncharacterized membrane protein|nr:DUF819 family protein [Prolixibacteraceae bacterium]MBT6006877.1 DUF819 family protein [Prolixibacteraceae bacterium]MBT6998163.1 DUF819 family protein [Prolixibacteraceae bacterium]MBT7395705.1 DUF819 family protein [Prolixibacteraceae bacterium]